MSAAATTQKMQALSLANEIRVASCRWRRSVADLEPCEGRALLADTLTQGDFPREIGTLHLYRFLTSAARLGPSLAHAICTEADIIRRDPRIRDLTARERFALAAALHRRAIGQRRDV